MARLTKSQLELKRLALTPVRKGDPSYTNICLVDFFSGLTQIIQQLEKTTRSPKAGPVRVVSLMASSYWDGIISVSLKTRTRGMTGLDRLDHGFEQLTFADRQLTFLLEESHMMKPKDMEKLVLHLDRIAIERGQKVRAILLCGRISEWNANRRVREMRWPRIPVRFQGWVERKKGGKTVRYPGRVPKGSILKFTRAGLDEIRGEKAEPSLFDGQSEDVRVGA